MRLSKCEVCSKKSKFIEQEASRLLKSSVIKTL